MVQLGEFIAVLVSSLLFFPFCVVVHRIVSNICYCVHHRGHDRRRMSKPALLPAHGRLKAVQWAEEEAQMSRHAPPLRLRVHAWLYNTTNWGMRMDLFQGILSALSCVLFVYVGGRALVAAPCRTRSCLTLDTVVA